MGPLWDEGVTGNGTQGYLTPTSQNVELISTAGEVYQMHRHAIPAFTTAGTDKVLVKNWSGTAYKAITNLYDIVADSGGNAIGATKWFKIVLWGVANLGTSSFHPMIINLPSSFYNTQTACENDADDTIDTVIPDDFRGTGYLIASIVIQRADTWVIGSTKDLRGQTAATIGGGGSRYTDTEAIAAVEAEDPLDLTGQVNITNFITNRVDNKGFFTGIGDDLRWFHNGTINIIDSGGVELRVLDAGDFNLQLTASFRVQDADDSNINLLILNTSARTLTIGAAADTITHNHNGDMNIKAGSLIMDGTTTDDEFLQLPYLTAAPASAVNGAMWMEADGVHIIRGGVEKTLTDS